MSEVHIDVTDEEGGRFRVNRISSAQLQPAMPMTVMRSPDPSIPEDAEASVGATLTFPNMHMQPRRSSLAQGLGGGRKKSVSLPKPFEGDDDYESGGGANPTIYGKNINYYTREALPNMQHYKNLASMALSARPTLDELRSEAMYNKKSYEPMEETVSQAVKFGWIEGVLVRCLLNIWGVMLFLRLSWVVAQAGIGLAIVIICLSATVTTLTALSMSAISTNGQIKGGGIYYMISRALGPEFGGAVGAIFSFANATAVAMHTVGFAESLNDLLKTLQVKIIDNAQNDIRIVGTIALIVMQSIIIIGTEWESKAQIVLLIILLVAIADFLIGAFIGPTDPTEISKGYVGFNATVLASNFIPNFRETDGTKHGFFTIFAIFFPAATGITAGANISGDLKDPSAAIPKGTLLAILTTTASYIIFALLAGAECVRDATGPPVDANLTDEFIKNFDFLNCTSGAKCEWGMHNSFQIMELMSIFGPIIYAGCFAATLSSALACLVSAPKIFQALCKDNLYPYIGVFGKGFRKNNDPFYAYIVAFIIALAFILIAELNAIAPLISNFYMAAYAMVNFCTFHAALVKPIGWRPTFRYYSVYSSFIGFCLCVAIMFLMSWITALVTIAILACLFFVLVYIKPEVNWGSSAQAQTFKSALNSVQSLVHVQDHVKNYRPLVLLLSGRPSSRPTLVEFANLITKTNGMLVCGHIIQERQPYKVRDYLQDKAYNWLTQKKIKAFYVLVDDVDFEEGARCLIQASGIGKMRPNIILMGFKSDWAVSDSEDVKAYFRVIHDALDNHMGFCILRLREGLDYAGIIQEDSDEAVADLTRQDSNNSFESKEPTNPDMSPVGEGEINEGFAIDPTDAEVEVKTSKKEKKDSKKKKELGSDLRGPGGAPLPKSVVNHLTQFQRKQGKSTIDIWWLYDDGGLTMLLPYIISTRSMWHGNKIRVFALANKQNDLEVEQANLASLLSKFRLSYSDLTIITDSTTRARDDTRKLFNEILDEYRKNNEKISDDEMIIDESELKAMKEKTNRHLRLRELMLDHSRQSNLIVMTLPIPRKGGVSAPLYMAWLEILTRDMPPFLLVRGNQESVFLFTTNAVATEPGSNPELGTSTTTIRDDNHTILVTETTNFIEKGNAEMKFAEKDKKSILVVGLTGAGKTTITQLVSGDNSKMSAYEETIGTGMFLIKDENKRISEQNIVSKTFIPELVIDKATNEALYDCPGFEDTRNASVEIANAYFIKSIVDHSEGIKIALIVSYDTVKSGRSRTNFKSLLDNLLKFLKQPENFQNSIAMVVTKVERVEGQTHSGIVKSVVSFLERFPDELKQTSSDFSEEKAKVVINSLLRKENDRYPNIAFFIQPNRAGVLSEMKEMEENRDRIRATLFKNPFFDYQAKGSSTFGVSLSYKAQNVINNVLLSLERKATETLKEVETALRETFESPRAQLKTLNDTLRDFSLLQNVLVNDSRSSPASNLMTAYTEALTKAGFSPPKGLFKRVKDYLGSFKFLEETRDENSDKVTSKISVQVFQTLVTGTEDFGSKALRRFLDDFPQDLFASYDLKMKSLTTYQAMKTSATTFTQSLAQLGPRFRGLSLGKTVDELNAELERRGIHDGRAVLSLASAFDDFHNEVVSKAEGDGRGRDDVQNSLVRAVERFENEMKTYHSLFERLDGLIASRDTVGWTSDPAERVEEIPLSSSHAKKKLKEDLRLLYTQTKEHKQGTKSGNEHILFVQGHVIKASELTKQVASNGNNVNYLVLEATMTVKIDEDLILPGITLFIFAPKLIVIGVKRISLDGAPGQNYSNPADAGQEGAVGNPGGVGGTFLCFVGTIHQDSGTLKISANGGQGGVGQKGGSGDYNTAELNGKDVDSSQIKMIGMEDITAPYDRRRLTNGEKKLECCQSSCENCTKYLAWGEPGQRGRDGARGGRGGEGGAPGRIHTTSYRQGVDFSSITKYAEQGTPGVGGPGGDAGLGGLNGAGVQVERIHNTTQTVTYEKKNKTEEFGEIFPVLGHVVGMWADLQWPEPSTHTREEPVAGTLNPIPGTVPSELRGQPGNSGPGGNFGPASVNVVSSTKPLAYTPLEANMHYQEFLKGFEENVFLRQTILEYNQADKDRFNSI